MNTQRESSDSTPKTSLISDNASGVHERVMAALLEANHGNRVGYGDDPLTARARACFKDVFGGQAEVFLMFNGTGANVLALKGMVRSHETVYCSQEAHLLVDECGAPESVVGCKLIALPTRQGKIGARSLNDRVASSIASPHRSQPGAVTLSQATERGTLYTLDELREIAAIAHGHGLPVHMDGARIANAAVGLGASFREMTTDIGVDLVSFGGTKNGLMMAEALVVLNPRLAGVYPFIRKQGMQLASKHRFLAAQYLAYFENDLWHANASNANAMAAYLAEGLESVRNVAVTSPVEANIVFASLPRAWIAQLQRVCSFLVWNADRSEVRFVASFDTTREDIDRFLGEIAELSEQER